jgi:hypothetical protein
MIGFAYSGGPLADRADQIHSLKVYLVGEGHWPAGAYIRNADGILVWREHGDYIPVDDDCSDRLDP